MSILIKQASVPTVIYATTCCCGWAASYIVRLGPTAELHGYPECCRRRVRYLSEGGVARVAAGVSQRITLSPLLEEASYMKTSQHSVVRGWTVDPVRGRLKFPCPKVCKFEPSLKNVRHTSKYKLSITDYRHKPYCKLPHECVLLPSPLHWRKATPQLKAEKKIKLSWNKIMHRSSEIKDKYDNISAHILH